MKKLSLTGIIALFLVMFCCFIPKSSKAQLAAGDIAIVGFNGLNLTAEMSIMALKELPANTVINITDYAYQDGNFIANSTDGVLTWTSPAAAVIPAGTVISLKFDKISAIITPNLGTASITGWTLGNIVPTVAGDAWSIYTDIAGVKTFIYAMGNWSTTAAQFTLDPVTGWVIPGVATGSATSQLPPGLAAEKAYVTLTNNPPGYTHESSVYNYYNASLTGSRSTLLANINNPDNWHSDKTVLTSITPGTVGAFPGAQPVFTIPTNPTISSVTSSPSTGTSGAGSSIAVTVTFSENVIVTGTPRIKLNSGTNAYALWTSGSNSKNLIFTYTVASGESNADLDYSSSTSLELNGGTLKNAQSDVAILSLPAPGTALSLGGSSSVVIDGISPTITSVTAVTANGSYGVGQTIDINLNYSEAITVTGTPTLSLNNTGVASYRSGSGTSSLTFRYTIAAGNDIADLDYATVSSLSFAGGTIKDAAGNDAISTLPAPGLAGSLGANANIIIDTTSPTVTGVSGTNGTYNIGMTAPIRVAFTENVAVTGTPQLTLSTSGPAAIANYASGSGTSILTFNYTVLAGQANPDLDYSASNSLSLNGGTIKDAAGNSANLALPIPSTSGSLSWNSDLTINGIRPTITSIARTGGATALTNSTSVNFTVTFSETVSGVDLGDFSITSTGGLVTPGITGVTGTGTTYTVTVSTGSTNASGTLRLDLINGVTGITANSGNTILGGYTSGETYTVDRTLPTLSAVSIASNNSNTQIARNGDIVTLTFTASEAVNLPSVTINSSPVIVTNTSGSSYTVNYPVSIVDPEGQITFSINLTDLIGNVGLPHSTTTDATKVVVDNIPVTITSVSTTAGNGPHGIGAILPISVTFSEPVTVSGTPRIALSSGGTANYSGGSTSAVLNFNYTVAAGQNTAQLDYTSITALTLTGGATINDQNGIAAPLTLPAPGGTGSLADGRTIVINGNTPSALSINRKTPLTQSTNASSVEYLITFNEPVTGVDILDFQMVPGSAAGTALSSVTGSGATYTITLTTGVNNGPFAINLKSAATGIVNLASNPIALGFGPSQIYTIDRVVPTIPTAIIASNHSGNPQIAIPGDVITLNFSSSEVITPVVTISGNATTLTNTSGNNWKATYTMLSTDDDGPVTFDISYSDVAGNPGINKTTTTNSSYVTFDKTIPTLTSVTIASNNISNTAYAKPGDMVTLRFTTSETVLTPVVVVGGLTVPVLPSGLPNSYMAFYAVQSTAAEGEIPFTINFTDQAGNIGTTVTTVTTGSMVTLDKTTPTINTVSISSSNPNPALAKAGDVISLTFTASETITSPTVTLFGSKTATVTALGNNLWKASYTADQTDPEGVVAFNINYSDLAGNAGTAVSTTNDATSVTYDRTVPVAPTFLAVTPGDTQNTLTWFLNADYAKYELIGGTPLVLGNNVLTTVLAANATNPMTYTQTGLTNFTAYFYALRVTDAAGNVNTSYTVNGTPLNSQTITFNQPAAAEYGSSFTLDATSSSGLPVTFTSNEPALATISGNTVTVVGANHLQSVSIIATQPGNASYSYAPPVIRLLQITPKPVTVTATAQSKVFNDVDPALATPTISPALVGSDVSTGTLSRATGEDAGTYEIQQNTFNLDQYKYAINYVPADFTITKKPVTITPQLAYSKTYGAADPAFAYNFTPLVSPDVITGELSRVSGEDAGTYNFDLGTLSAGANYNLVLSPLPQFTINKAVITVTPITASIEYGDTEPVIAYNHTPALQTGDAFTGSLSRAIGNTPNNYLINQGTLALSNNYTLDFSTTPVNFVVTKKNISITPTAGQGKVYGEADGTINYAASPALLNGDTFNGALSRAAGTAVSNYPIEIGTLSTTNPQNYNLQLAAENYAITKKTIMVTATAVSQAYGDADPVALPYTLSAPLQNGDVPTGALGRTAGTDVGSYPINAGNLSLGANYDQAFTPANLTITPKTIAITPISNSKTYGGVDPTFAYNFTPLVSPDVITGDLARVAGEDVGDYSFELGTLTAGTNYNLTLSSLPKFTINKSVITVTPITASIEYGDTEPVIAYNHTPALQTGDAFTGSLSRAPGNTPNNYLINQGTLALSNNYTLDFSTTPVNFVVTKKNISITPTAGQGKVYGQADGTINYAASPALLNGDTFSGALSRAAGTAVANYPIEIGTLSTTNPQNYNLQLAAENYAITQKAIMVTATAVIQAYGDADPVSLPYTLSAPLQNGDVPTGSLARAAGTDVGTYPINAGNLSLGANYDMSFTAADLTITPKIITITAESDAKTYGDADPIFAYTGNSALINGAVYTGKLGRIAGEDVGNYALTLGDLQVNNNYSLTLNPGAALTINKKEINVIAEAQSKVYGSTDPILTYTSNPTLIAGDNFSGALSRRAGEHVGNYEIGQGGLTLSANYNLNYTPDNLSITAKPINIQINANSKTYGAAEPELTYTAIPSLQTNDVFTGAISRVAGENKGSYLISKGTLAAGADYDLNFTNANFEINPAPLTITADPKTKFVGTANPVFTGQYDGFVNGENSSVLTSQPNYTSVATTNSPIGTYPIVASGAVAANYEITHINAVLTVVAGAPTNVLFAGTTLYENQPAGTKAGDLSSTSDDLNATFTYTLVSGNGDTDNASFRIAGDQLQTNASLNYENKKVYSVRVKSTTQHGFSLEKTFNINLSDVNEIPTLDAIAAKTICYTTTGQTIDLTGISAGPDAGQNISLTVTGSNAALLQSLTVSAGAGGKGTISYRIKNGATGTSTITVTVKDDGGTAQGGVDTYSRTFVLTVNALPVVTINASTGNNNDGRSTTISKGQTVVLTANGGSNYVWAQHNSIISGQTSATLTLRPRETTTYTVTVSNANGCSEQKSFTVNVQDDLMTIKATNILTPNGDGYNDKWVIDNIDFYPNNDVKIFDKAGRMVYSKRSYDNSWDGMLNGMPLNEGTYYYVIDFGKDRPRFKGFITIVREN